MYTEMIYRQQTVTHPPSTNSAVHGRESTSQPVDHESDALTTTPPTMVLWRVSLQNEDYAGV